MKLTDGERLMVVMLSEVMEALKLNNEVDPSLIKTLVCGGDDWAIKRKYQGLFPSAEPSPEVVSETTDLLWMWGIIESSMGHLQGAEAAEAQTWLCREFHGFDGNNDDHFGVAQTMINRLDEFDDFKGRNLNSHSQASLPRYQAMYDKFEGYIKSGSASPLSFDALRDLCS